MHSVAQNPAKTLIKGENILLNNIKSQIINTIVNEGTEVDRRGKQTYPPRTVEWKGLNDFY
jgi:hypothetical protein